jgi:ribose-phosphate pyrophosphokinase
MMIDKLKVFSGNANISLAKGVCQYLNMELGKASVERFPDGEIDVKVYEDVRGADVFILQSTCPPVNENLMELLILIDCVKRASAGRITAVLPYFGYARQDRKAEGRVPITAKLVANLITISGVDRVLALDLHAAQIQGFFDIPVDHLFAAPVMIEYLKTLGLNSPVIVSPDVGGIKMARAYAKKLGAGLAIIDKRRTSGSDIEVFHIIGEVKGKDVILVDDIISTGKSLAEAVRVCADNQAKDIYICATHPVMAKSAYEKLRDSSIKEIIVTDSIPLDKSQVARNIRVLSIAKLLGEAIRRINRSESVSSLFI